MMSAETCWYLQSDELCFCHVLLYKHVLNSLKLTSTNVSVFILSGKSNPFFIA